MKLYIVRHGEPDYKTDTLTERGRLQSEAVGKRLFETGIDRVYTSPKGRAKQTAEPTCHMLGLEYCIEEWTREIGNERLTTYPDGELKSIAKLQNYIFREGDNQKLSFENAYMCQGLLESNMDEAVKYITKEGNSFLEKLGYREENGVYRVVRPNDEKVALFCHMAFSITWISVLLHIPLNIMWAGFGYTYTGVTVLEFKNNDNGITVPKCLCYSDVSHLYRENLDLFYDGAGFI